ncbi:MAG: hypothetical protein DRP56_03965 [Planctomycetota bacterium]|nr:MAG: hypothetical protein DRP56_03965 [Planctomycetota bacterium]
MNKPTEFMHELGPVVISQGIGRKNWGAYVVKPNGSLRRLKSIPNQPTPEGVQAFLDDYKGKTIWRVEA